MNTDLNQNFRKTRSRQPEHKEPPWGSLLIMIIISGILLIVATWREVEFLREDVRGKPVLSQERKRKLEKALNDLDNAEQYVLQVKRDGYYSCFSCPAKSKIYLKKGEVWRYGSTTKGEKGRYKNSLDSQNLVYFVQFRGTYQECLKQELIKIYEYPMLPENVIRERPLIRPPGNKIDR